MILGLISLTFAAAITVVVALQSDELEPAPAVSDPFAVVDAAAAVATDEVRLRSAEPVVTPIEEPIDANRAPVEVPIDASVASAPIAAVKAPAQRPRARPVKPKPDPNKRHADLVAACAASTAVDRAACTLAACALGDAARARKWAARVSVADRPRVVKACDAASIVLDLPKPKPDCQPTDGVPA